MLAAALAIVFGILIGKEPAVVAFSGFLRTQIHSIVFIVGITTGAILLILALLSLVLLTPLKKRWMYLLYSPLLLLTFTLLLGVAAYL